MLTELRISGLGVIEDAVLDPHPGFTVVTGETGAGKTMIVTALGLISGGRGDSGRVRVGSDRAVVEARLQVDPDGAAAETVAAAGGRLDEDGSVIAVRSVGADGRSRAHIGGRSAPLATLTELTEQLVAVHGQSEAISLLRSSEQRAVLDRFAALSADLEEYRRLRETWQQEVAELNDRVGRARERAEREQVLRLGLDEIEKSAPLPGEDAELLAGVRRLENADALRSAAQEALTALTGAETLSDNATAVSLIEAARKQLSGTGDERLLAWDQALHQASGVLTDAAADLAAYLDSLDADPARLEQLLARQAVLRTLTRRYGQDTDAVLSWADAARAELAALDSSEETLAALRAHCEQLRTKVATAAKRISKRRSTAAAALGEAATLELEHLAMGRATLRVAVSHRSTQETAADAVQVDGRWVAAGPEGIDQVDIVMTAHRGAPELPINKGASGGELSRVMLALEVVLAGADPVGTLVFDEVDAGVGGRAATEIGKRLAMLAGSHQVIVVTHLAQVAAFADRQFVVDAGPDGVVGTSSVQQVTGAARQAELARMLGGTDGESALAHAADLLISAAGETRR